MKRRVTEWRPGRVAWTIVAGIAAAAGGCIAEPGESGEAVDRAGVERRAPDGSIRRPFFGGAFVTYAPEMPIELDQAIAGQRPDRPVVVWAGK